MLKIKFFVRKGIKIIIFCIVIVFITEVIARIITGNEWLLETTSQFSSVRWRLLWIKKHNSSKATNYPIDVYHPLLGWYPMKNAKNILASNALVSFNSDGIRGEKEYTKEKLPNTSRIVIIGDSFTFGESVKDTETFTAQLEQSIPNTEVLNMGVHGYGLDQMALRLRLDGLKYNPDIIIFAFIDDDINRIPLGFRDYMKPKYKLINGNLHLVNTPIPAPENLIRHLRYSSRIPDTFQLFYDRVAYRDFKHQNLASLTNAILKQVVEDTKNNNAIPIILFLPTSDEITMPLDVQIYAESLMFSFCKLEDIVCFSARSYLAPVFENGNKYNIDIYKHYQPFTHWLIANGLAKDLIEKYPMLKIQDKH